MRMQKTPIPQWLSARISRTSAAIVMETAKRYAVDEMKEAF
jgi:hypothetical protein